MALLTQVRVVVCLGNFAYVAACEHFRVTRRPKFAHGLVVPVAGDTADRMPRGGVHLVCSYHPSQQNTFTGRLTEPMLDAVFATALRLARAPD